MKKILALLLVLCMLLSMAACSGSSNETEGTESSASADSTDSTDASEGGEESDAWTPIDTSSYDDYYELSTDLYDAILGEYYEYYEMADEASSTSERWALMAVAEAKLMESAVMIPIYTSGGNYAISRIAPYSTNYALWGSDSDRYSKALVTTEFITAEDRAELKALWNELRGTGTWYETLKEKLVEMGYELDDTYNTTFTALPETWDVLATSKSADSEAIINTFDGLLEYDTEGNQVAALATSYEVSDDGLTYTFHIREGAQWVTSQGVYVADVTADDWVAAMQHMMDAKGGLEYLIEGVIVGAYEYIYEGGSFDDVGVEAVDDYTLVYTLCELIEYFPTMLGYSIFAPMCRSYYVSLGGTFGDDYATSGSGTYGTSPDTILYCGPYLVTNCTENSIVTFSENPYYWNAGTLGVTTINWLYNDGSDATKSYYDAVEGVITGVGLTTTTMVLAEEDGLFDEYAYVTTPSTTSYVGFMNINRATYANTNDTTTVVSPQTEEDAARTAIAMQNQNFRLAVAMGWDRVSRNAQRVGDELAANGLINSYTPGNFVSLTEDVTIDINGTATTFAAGTYYGAIMQAQIDADGYPITVWDPDADDGLGSSYGYDGWYSIENCQYYLSIAVEELASAGVEVSAENPIYLDLPYYSSSTTYTNMAQVVKQSVEEATGGLVIINLVECTDSAQWYYAGYYTNYGYEANYDIYDLSGWGPDFGDPCTYLDTFLPDYAGYMVKCIGIF
ncbi:MAG: ABC transporter substrate-binding protein [Firmicutes bacterium]|nr:ABC transporter substrate-binding protein [Bacillota bacterium]